MKQINFIIISIIIMFTLSGCVFQAGGAKIYAAIATTEEGEKAIKEYNIKYVSPDVYGFYWTDFYRTNGVFAINIIENRSAIKYSSLKQDYADKLELKPNFTFWEKYGVWVFLSALSLFILLFVAVDNKWIA